MSFDHMQIKHIRWQQQKYLSLKDFIFSQNPVETNLDGSLLNPSVYICKNEVIQIRLDITKTFIIRRGNGDNFAISLYMSMKCKTENFCDSSLHAIRTMAEDQSTIQSVSFTSTFSLQQPKKC